MSKGNGSIDLAKWRQQIADQFLAAKPEVIREPAPTSAEETVSDQRPTIKVTGGDRHELVDKAEAHIARRKDLYQHAGRLVRITPRGPTPAAAGRSPGNHNQSELAPARMAAVSADWLTTELTREICWKSTRKGWNANAPDYLARAVIEHRDWPTIRPLEGITASPIVRPDGTVRTESGYDSETRLLLTASEEFLPVVGKPSKSDAQAAADALAGVFQHYRFANRACISTALSLILTRLARHLMPLAPFHLITSPSSGTGKTEIVKAVSRICDGTDASLRSWPGNDEELRKVVTSCVLASQIMVCFDNCPNGEEIASPVLDQLLTTPVYEDRLLGQNTNIYAKNNLLLVGTGNNVRFAQDSIRRIIVARVLPTTEEPWNYHFPWTPSEYARTHRRELLFAACTILSAFIQAGEPAPEGVPPLGSFERWSTLIRNALIWVGQADPCTTQVELVTADSGRESLSRLVELLRSRFQSNSFLVSEVLAAASETSPHCAELKELLQSLYSNTGPTSRSPTPQWLGKYFQAQKDCVVHEYCISGQINKTAHANRWCIKHAADVPGVRVVTSSDSNA